MCLCHAKIVVHFVWKNIECATFIFDTSRLCTKFHNKNLTLFIMAIISYGVSFETKVNAISFPDFISQIEFYVSLSFPSAQLFIYSFLWSCLIQAPASCLSGGSHTIQMTHLSSSHVHTLMFNLFIGLSFERPYLIKGLNLMIAKSMKSADFRIRCGFCGF